MLNVDGGQLAGAQQGGLLARPGHHVLLVPRSHDRSTMKIRLEVSVFAGQSHIEAWACRRGVDNVVERMREAGVPASPINTVDRLVMDPHIAGARQTFVDMDHPKADKTKLAGAHIKLSATPARLRSPAPQFDEHNADVFGTLLRLTADELAQLRVEGII